MRFNNSLQICFQFFVKAVAKLSDFTVIKEFKTIRNTLWKYDVVLFDFMFGQTASWKWLYDVCIIASFRSKITYNVAALEMSLNLYFWYGQWITHTFLLCLYFQSNGQRITQFFKYICFQCFRPHFQCLWTVNNVVFI